MELKKHFKTLHVKEREKKMNRMRQLKGKKRQRFKERFIIWNHKCEEATRSLIVSKTGYGLAGELRRAGVFVKTVEDKLQAANWALKKQMMHVIGCGVDWVVLVSDDLDFVEVLRRAKGASLGTLQRSRPFLKGERRLNLTRMMKVITSRIVTPMKKKMIGTHDITKYQYAWWEEPIQRFKDCTYLFLQEASGKLKL